MTKQVRIPVPGGIITHSGVLHEVVLEEPGYEAYIELGEITTWAQSPDKTVFSVESAEVLRAYIARSLVSPKDPLLLNQGGIKLARAVKGAVMGFFRDEPSDPEPSPTSPTTSSSNASPDDSPPTPSAG